MAEEVPDSQLTRGSRNQAADGEEGEDEDQDDRAASQRKWVDKVCQGVQKVLQSERGRLVFAAHPAAVKDLQKCMELLQSEDPLPFDWDVSIYVDLEPHPPSSAAGSRRSLALVQESELSGDDEEGEEEVPSTTWLINSICVISTDPPPFWAVVR